RVDNIYTNRWYQLVMELDSGDALDPNAGVTLYVNGKLDEDGDGNPVPARIPHAGSWYNGATKCDADGKLPLNAPTPGLPGLCTEQDGDRTFECLNWQTGQMMNCWTIFPKNADAPLRFGTVNGESWFAGRLDEAIIFDRK